MGVGERKNNRSNGAGGDGEKKEGVGGKRVRERLRSRKIDQE